MHSTNPGGDSASARRAACATCAACGAARPRRAFLREAGRILAGVGVTLGLTPSGVAGLSLDVVRSIGTFGTDAAYPIPVQDGVMIDKAHEVILVRDRGAVYAFALSCPHQRTPLRWVDTERLFRCPKHKSTYQPDGAFVSGRATRGMDRYAIRRQANTVVVSLALVFRQDEDAAGWDAAVVKL